jgi:succinoglycan biosynthesis transport protein ExoP
LADCFLATATSILYAGENGDRPRVIVLTSANPGEGKTTVASNLALALAEIGSARSPDRRRSAQGAAARNFQMSNSWGLSDLLAGKKPPQGSEKMPISRPAMSACICCQPGQCPSVSQACSIHHRTLEFLNHAREEFHTVIIDTPPMLQMADARVLGKVADAVVLVVRSAETTRDEASAAAQRLTEDGTRVLGTILNEWDTRKTSRAGGYGYRSYHYHERSQG